jgi:predicted metal-binding membrane protein
MTAPVLDPSRTNMADRLQLKNSTSAGQTAWPAEFIVLSALAFVGSVAATIYFCRSMGGGMHMPGGWTMSMMWMRMNGQTWFASAAGFLLMWLAMMVAMMLPSVLPTFLKIRRTPASLSLVAAGYFAVWLAAGAGIYVLGVLFGAAAMCWESFSHVVPALSGVALLTAGAIQFTRWKMTGLLRCRSRFGCASSCPEREADFRLGCQQGATCCRCCAAPMTILIVLGMMNPFTIICVALVIAAEKLLPRPAVAARLVGISAIIAGVASLFVTCAVI